MWSTPTTRNTTNHQAAPVGGLFLCAGHGGRDPGAATATAAIPGGHGDPSASAFGRYSLRNYLAKLPRTKKNQAPIQGRLAERGGVVYESIQVMQSLPCDAC